MNICFPGFQVCLMCPSVTREVLIRASLSLQQTGQAKSVPTGRQREMNKGGVSSAASNSVGVVVQPEMLSSMLAAASPEQQKQILGEQLYPLVHKQKVTLSPH